jgi:hypothetical protein
MEESDLTPELVGPLRIHGGAAMMPSLKNNEVIGYHQRLVSAGQGIPEFRSKARWRHRGIESRGHSISPVEGTYLAVADSGMNLGLFKGATFRYLLCQRIPDAKKGSLGLWVRLIATAFSD